MGANRRNHYWQSRRFSALYKIADNAEYNRLVDRYLETKEHCQKGSQGHNNHVESIKALASYLSGVPVKHN